MTAYSVGELQAQVHDLNGQRKSLRGKLRREKAARRSKDEQLREQGAALASALAEVSRLRAALDRAREAIANVLCRDCGEFADQREDAGCNRCARNVLALRSAAAALVATDPTEEETDADE